MGVEFPRIISPRALASASSVLDSGGMKKSLLYGAATQWSVGLGLHTTGLGLVHFTSGSILSDLNNARQMELTYQAARSATLAASNVVQSSRAAALVFAEKARTVLKVYLGEQWSTAWAQAGFINPSLRLPANTPGVLATVQALQTYFAGHTTQQNANVGVTAAAA